jgi:hypothetical protein
MLAEAHTAWVPGWLALLDYTYLTIGRGSPFARRSRTGYGEVKLDLKPSDFFRRQCYVSAFPDDEMIVEADAVGPGNILVGTDWPHPVAIGRATIAEFAGRTDLDDERKRAMLIDNSEAMLASAR